MGARLEKSMIKRYLGPQANAAREVTDRVLSERLNDARKQEVLEIYEELLRTVWDRILPTLGRATVIAITERALVLTREHFPVIEQLTVGPDGLVFDQLRGAMGESEVSAIREALQELVADVIDILAILTGDALVKQLVTEIEVRRGP